ncbi:MAG: hypothetical protein A2339_00375 [Elusimicrobia bacterium RIFOXYB12_FULL_50_12]|nr:MAG: hypothetical protein A2278_05935 [Elusimicrobia bacterium RIFOXYA12_FULL_49_49]OGS11317.1 MAG: hypothetical protein A2386_08355 [Elusimicrobia bacterium RIFOXYB1_FULL_48_9]OGS16666.1 MAG: hypothetical protein A2251_04800 [Elusimicrobia bacterium RIFOXYA2_FULL_47_53]OGS25515.1 MAG: hypothetical protein A2339_00375 [Elusimicrobia bacterium RIFOXYB12_FULL_50_12]OGS31644.1 MAG: hypothetical protein A2323_03520 [Elusimicrobia bacterium RIFOXYB2_FULL_46_23]
MLIKLLRIALIAFTIVCLMFLGVIGIAGLVVGSERVQKSIAVGLRGYLNREVSFSKIVFNPFSGAAFNGFRISENPDFRSGEFFSAQAVKFSFGWPIFREERSSFGRLELLSPVLTLKNLETGKLNALDFVSSVRRGKSSMSKYYGAPAAVLADSFAVSDGKIYFPDGMVLENIQISARSFSVKRKFDFNLDAQLVSPGDTIFLNASGTADFPGGALTSLAINALAGDEPLSLSGSVSRSDGKAYSYDFLLSGKREAVNKILAILSPRAALPELGGPDDVNVKLTGKQGSFKAFRVKKVEK